MTAEICTTTSVVVFSLFAKCARSEKIMSLFHPAPSYDAAFSLALLLVNCNPTSSPLTLHPFLNRMPAPFAGKPVCSSLTDAALHR
mmetsp:Transcript_557/g.1105  ORF Transcript_557/g.1105 Transcript_557/m.1105 type:complete len:86 (+) Transcript_557:379-636(+)